MRVLIADDDLGSRLVAKAALQAQGHECLTAADGDEAWQLLSQFNPDVLVTDRSMPGMDGLALCRRIRASDQDGYTYIVLLTGLDDPDEITAGMQAGADDYLTKPLDPFALHTRLLAARRVTDLHVELAKARALLLEQANTDPLTGLRNRHGLEADLEQLDHLSSRYGRSYCIAMCDIDFFKAYNDAYGHPAGDQALRTVGASLSEVARQGDRIYRYGGEEFLVLLPEQDLAGAAAALERMRAHLTGLGIAHPSGGPGAVLTISAGLAACSATERVLSRDVLAEADQALYEAKRGGRDRIAVAAAARTDAVPHRA